MKLGHCLGGGGGGGAINVWHTCTGDAILEHDTGDGIGDGIGEGNEAGNGPGTAAIVWTGGETSRGLCSTSKKLWNEK